MTLLLLLAACGPRHPLSPETCVPADLVRAAERRVEAMAEGPVGAHFSIHIERADHTVNANGNLVVAPPGRFRFEVSGPVGPPQLVVTSDGTRVAAWLAGEKTLYVADDAPALLDTLSGGALGLDAVVAALLARVPAPGPAVQVDGTRWTVPDRAAVEIGTDCASGTWLGGLVVRRPDGAPLLELVGTPVKGHYQALTLALAPLSTRVELAFDPWKAATPTDAAFTLNPPPNARVVPLSEVVGTGAPAPAPPGTPPAPAPTP